MRIAVIDDQPADRDYITVLVSRWAKERDQIAVSVPFPSEEALMFVYAETGIFETLRLCPI